LSDHAIPVTAETVPDKSRADPAAGPVPAGLPGLLASLRRRGGLSQNALARLADVSPSTVNNLESGQRHPTRELSLQIARSLGLAPAETDTLLVAARHAPDLTDRISPADPDLRLVVAILADDSLPPDRREHFRALIRHAAAFAGCRADAEVAE
jgi:transcriptional regulator with XRE-family HTH domain